MSSGKETMPKVGPVNGKAVGAHKEAKAGPALGKEERAILLLQPVGTPRIVAMKISASGQCRFTIKWEQAGGTWKQANACQGRRFMVDQAERREQIGLLRVTQGA